MNLSYIVILIGCILVALSVHEAVHAWVGYLLGDTTAEEQGRLSLNPLRHIDLTTTIILPVVTLLLFHAPVLAAKPVPFNPSRVRFGEWGAALIAVSGPLSNLIMAFLASLLLHISSYGGVVEEVISTFMTLNVALFIFNLIPIPPLDGSRVLYAVAPEPVQAFMASIEPYGFFIIITLVLLGGFSEVMISLNQAVLHLLLW